ncbi:hypothetical protein [Tenacibaculum sp. 190524A05c]|uniref:hypothetical protein n=1 Tax=Tenacibaculum platacis TaxID=3137852 RepID=UPI0032B1D28B
MKISIKILFSISLLYFISCKETPNYNPFDDQFDVNVSKLIKDNCDTISAGCGYFNLQENSGRLRTYYQIYMDDWRKVVAKGFNYSLDTMQIDTSNISKSQYKSIINNLNNLDVKKLNSELRKFNFSYLKKEESIIFIHNSVDTLSLELFTDFNKGIVTRHLSLFRVPAKKRN